MCCFSLAITVYDGYVGLCKRKKQYMCIGTYVLCPVLFCLISKFIFHILALAGCLLSSHLTRTSLHSVVVNAVSLCELVYILVRLVDSLCDLNTKNDFLNSG